MMTDNRTDNEELGPLLNNLIEKIPALIPVLSKYEARFTGIELPIFISLVGMLITSRNVSADTIQRAIPRRLWELPLQGCEREVMETILYNLRGRGPFVNFGDLIKLIADLCSEFQCVLENLPAMTTQVEDIVSMQTRFDPSATN